jgi:hypothetical protein
MQKKSLKFKHDRAKKWSNYKNKQNLNIPLGEHIGNEKRNVHVKVL